MSAGQELRTERRGDYPRFSAIPLLETDNDAHGRASSAACCAWFERVVDECLQREGGSDTDSDGFRAHTFEASCRFHRAFGFPDTIEAGLRVAQLGSSSVRFELGLFRPGEDKPVATGSVVRVFVARANDKPAPLPAGLRAALGGLSHSGRD